MTLIEEHTEDTKKELEWFKWQRKIEKKKEEKD
jgi:hypothetical protein